MRFTTIALAALAAIVASAAPAGAQAPETHFVCEEVGACEFNSIQAAVNTATAGDTIRVRSGLYREHVTIPAGKDGLVLRGAQAGVPGSARAGRSPTEESLVFGASYGASPGTALSVASSGVIVDGFSIGVYEQGIWSATSTSGLQVLNSRFANVGNSVVPDSNGEQETVIRSNAFERNAVNRGATKGYAIVTGASRGRLVVAHNRIVGHGSLLAHFGLRGRNVTVQGNRASDSDGILATLLSVDGAVIEGNVVDSTTSTALAYLSDTRDVAVTGNVVTGGGGTSGVILARLNGPNRDPVIEANDFSGSGQLDAIYARPGSVEGTLVARYNRFATGVRGLLADGPFSIDARFNWWGCNEGPNRPGCATLDRYQGASVRTFPWLTLSIETDSSRIVNAFGGTTTFRASLLRDSDGTVHEPTRFPRISFSVNSASGSRVADLVHLHPGVVGGTLVADGGQGADLEALVDGAEVRTHVDYGPAAAPNPIPGPQGDGGAASQPGPTVSTTPTPAANTCRTSARTLVCILAGKAGRASRARGVTATLYHSGRRIATGSVRLSGGKVQLRVGRRVAAGRYDLVLTRAGRRLARQAVTVS
jgi:hypothetical protein